MADSGVLYIYHAIPSIIFVPHLRLLVSTTPALQTAQKSLRSICREATLNLDFLSGIDDMDSSLEDSVSTHRSEQSSSIPPIFHIAET
jgi:hypothetical protein